MKNPITSISNLKQGSVADIMSYYMLDSAEDQKGFLDIVSGNRGKCNHLLEEYNLVYGYRPSPDLLEFEEAFGAYGKYFDSISDVWIMEEGISYVSELSKKLYLHELVQDWTFIITMLTGLEMAGRDPGGDSCFIDTLPNEFSTSEVLIFDHETGNLSDYTAFSIADFISDYWGVSYDHETGDEVDKHSNDVKKIIEAFNKEAKKTGEKRPLYHSPKKLYKRTHWIMGHPTGKPTYAFAKKMADAPTFADWENEKALLKDEPVLANYWLLAHYFLDNKKSLEETIILTGETHSAVTRELAAIVEKLLKDPEKAELGRLNQEKIVKLKSETRKNCIPEMLEPEQREALLTERGVDKIKTLSPQKFKELIARGTEPMEIIREYPLDVATHDRALKELGSRDKDFLETVDEYFNERSQKAYNRWPYGEKSLDKRFAIPVAAAFRSGLMFDEDNINAYSGITKTMSKFDDDNAYAAYEEAIKKLNPDDDRIESVINNLAKSEHPRREEVLVLAANRIFDILEKIEGNEDEQARERADEGYTLDNMFDVENHFLAAMRMVLKLNNDESIKLAHRILQHEEERQLFKWHVGDAFRIAGDNNIKEYSEYLELFINAVDGIESNPEYGLENISLYNFTEAVIAYTKLEPQKAAPLLEKMFNKDTGAKWFDLDIKSGVLPGLMLLNPEDETLHSWTKRLLGNRNNAPMIRGALRAVAEIKLLKARNWALYHLYSDYNSFMKEQYLIKILAREAMDALGENLPDFDDDDEFASRLARESDEKLIEGFAHPEKYRPRYICKKIHENNIQSKEALSAIALYLKDLLYYSSDEKEYIKIWDGLKALSVQGPEALEVCADLINLEFIDQGYITDIIYAMRTFEDEARIREWLSGASTEEIVKELTDPRPRFIPWSDLLAARLFFTGSEEAETAIETALLKRYTQISDSGWSDEEPTGVRLPLVYGALGKGDTLSKIKNRLENRDESFYNAIKNLDNGLENRMPEDIPAIKKNVTLKFTSKIKGENYDGPEYFLELAVKGTGIDFRCGVENLYFQSFVEGEKLESHGEISSDTEQTALECAENMIKEVLLLNYTQSS
jgi:hypothetical protein